MFKCLYFRTRIVRPGVRNEEIYFLHKLGELLNVPDSFITTSIKNTDDFINKHKKNIPYFNYSNPIDSKNNEDDFKENYNKIFNPNFNQSEFLTLKSDDKNNMKIDSPPKSYNNIK